LKSPVLLITAGPTREPIDDVRFLSNGASGTLGIEVASAAQAKGWEVHLALGPVHLIPPEGVIHHPFTTACELEQIAVELWPRVDAMVASAAVCDYRPAERIAGKRKKSGEDWNLTLIRNPDVLAGRGAQKEDERGQRVLVGFALEADQSEEEARRKAVNKRLDLVLCNTPDNLGTAMGDYVWIEPGEPAVKLLDVAKRDLAVKIVEFIGTRVASRRCDRAFNGE